MMESINSPNGTISTRSLNQEWENVIKLKKMISRTERVDIESIKNDVLLQVFCLVSIQYYFL